MTTEYVLLATLPYPQKLVSLAINELNDQLRGNFVAPTDRNDPDVAKVEKLFKDAANSSSNDATDGYLTFRGVNDVDGGNGSGGGDGTGPNDKSLRVRQTSLGKSFWNFRGCPGTSTTADTVRFPQQLRFEVCLHFRNFKAADAFLKETDGGFSKLELLQKVFQFVELVAVTERKP